MGMNLKCTTLHFSVLYPMVDAACVAHITSNPYDVVSYEHDTLDPMRGSCVEV
jgi:hypothetical protein